MSGRWVDLRETAEEPERVEPRSAAGGAQEGAERPWWRRLFRGDGEASR
jgi:hypothetical protein